MKSFFVIIFLLISGSNFCQIGNLVSNPGFDVTKGKVKEKGQIEIATGWISATNDKADLFSRKSKIPEYLVPENSFGTEEPNGGENYAGIVAQSVKNSIPRTYLQTELAQALEADKMYCVQFFVCLSDLSKFACNDLGVFVSNSAITSVEILKFEIKPQILNQKNRIFDGMYMFEPICATFQAKGGEKFITLGNFEKGTDAELKKMQRPKGFTKPQVNMAYYFIEDVSVTPLDEVEQCYCEKIEKKEVMNIVYTKSVTTGENDKKIPFKEIEHKKVFFDFKTTGISLDAGKTLGEIAKLMDENPQVKIEIIGNTESQEQANTQLANLSEDRAKSVFFYLNGKGVPEARMTYKGIGNSSPMSKDQSQVGRAQNRRVEFKITE